MAELPLLRTKNTIIAVDNRARRVDVAAEIARRRLLYCLKIGTVVLHAHDLPAHITALHAQLQREFQICSLIAHGDVRRGGTPVTHDAVDMQECRIAQVTALHEILKVDAELSPLQRIYPLRGRPCPTPDRRQNALYNPANDAVLDILVELS